ncbi:MAG TPA: PKD domain-containing protein [Gemmatimonadales bacterium]|nr:PKD domain-containing protein [Gemmatimonadales bacterium]
MGAAAAGTACGGDGGGPSNTAPTAAFSHACTGLACTFTDASSDPENDPLTYLWTFGEPTSGTNDTATVTSPSHTYAAAGSYHVKLTVTDSAGAASAVADSVVTVSTTTPPPPGGPIAGFTVACDGPVCTFTDTSTAATGRTIASWDWDFGDDSAHATTQNPTHTYDVADTISTFTVTLTVTDDQAATDSASDDITVTPPAGLQCSGVTCTLDVTNKATLTVTVDSARCEFAGNRFAITEPIQETVFTNGCVVSDGTVFHINNDLPFDAGTQIQAEFTQGAGKPTDPPRGTPAIQLTGTFPHWVIKIDDGGDPTGPGEPDFNDIILSVDATAVP